MHNSRSLAELQQWMLRAVADADDGGIPVPQVILPSKQLDAQQRLQIYGNAYILRLVQCLGDEYPAVKSALSEETFFGFAREYLQKSPPSSYTLNVLGAKFPEFLRETRPADEPPLSWADFLIDLARLERAYSQIFDGPGVEGVELLQLQDLANVTSEVWPDCRLKPVPCLRLEAFDFPVHLFATAVRKGDAPDVPEPEPTFLILTRRDYVVRRVPVSEAEYRLLGELAGGKTIGDSIEAVAEKFDAELEQHLSDWFHRWAAAGYFLAVETP